MIFAVASPSTRKAASQGLQENDVKILVWFRYFDAMADAILREKQMKEWKREWKIKLIVKSNPEWRDLYAETCGVYLP